MAPHQIGGCPLVTSSVRRDQRGIGLFTGPAGWAHVRGRDGIGAAKLSGGKSLGRAAFRISG
jgi:hypothetical protein